MTLIGFVEPFVGLATDCPEEWIVEEGTGGGPIDGRLFRAPMAEGFMVAEDMSEGVIFPADVVEPRCFVGDLVGD